MEVFLYVAIMSINSAYHIENYTTFFLLIKSIFQTRLSMDPVLTLQL